MWQDKKEKYELAPTDAPPPYEPLPISPDRRLQAPLSSESSGPLRWVRKLYTRRPPTILDTSPAQDVATLDTSHRTEPEHHARTKLKNGQGEKAACAYSKPVSPLQIKMGALSPRSVKCHCGVYCDTTKTEIGLPKGQVYCRCGYIVSYTGSSHHPSPPPAPPLRCDCNKPLPTRKTCSDCGLWLVYEGAVLRKTAEGLWDPATSVVKCRCRRLVNVTLRYEMHHKEPGKSHYNYTLPAGTAKCFCGATISADGTVVLGHTGGCCKRYERSSRREARR